MSQKLIKGCVVYMSSKSGCVGYGNPQCISNVCEPLGEISLYGHNQSYKIHDIREVVYYPSSPSDNTQSIDKDLAGKIWDAAERNTSQKLFDYTEKQLSVTAPDKETFINSLNLDNTQIRDGRVRVEDIEKEYKRGFDNGVKYRDGQHKAYFTINY